MSDTKKSPTTQSVDVIQKIVYAYLKPLGFRKHGRTMHRFVDEDISQVITLQNGCPAKGVFGVLWVDLGIRVPECAQRQFVVTAPLKKYYHEYECNIRSTLGVFPDGKEKIYDLDEDSEKIGEDIVKQLENDVIPVFDVLNSRDAILAHRAEFPRFDRFSNHLILLEESMIAGRRGDLEEATRLFNAHYRNVLAEYKRKIEYGSQVYLKKGKWIMYRNARTNENEKVIAAEDGFVTIYDANRGHLSHLEKLAKELEIELYTS